MGFGMLSILISPFYKISSKHFDFDVFVRKLFSVSAAFVESYICIRSIVMLQPQILRAGRNNFSTAQKEKNYLVILKILKLL